MLAAVAALAAVVVSACGVTTETGAHLTAEVTTTVAPTQTGESALTAGLGSDQQGCVGLEEPAETWEVTWIAEGELRTPSRCLVRFRSEHSAIRPSWDPSGRRLLVDIDAVTYVVSSSAVERLPDRSWSWLGTTGSLLNVGESELAVRRADASTSVVLRGQFRAAEGTPDGRSVVASGVVGDETGIFAISLADSSLRLLHAAPAEAVLTVQPLADGDVMFTETAGDRTGLYVVSPAGTVSVVTEGPAYEGVSGVGSPYDASALAWSRGGGCGGPPHTEARANGKRLALGGTPVGAVPPDSWTPDSALLFLDRGESCDYSAGTLWSYRDGDATKLAENVYDVGIRPKR